MCIVRAKKLAYAMDYRRPALNRSARFVLGLRERPARSIIGLRQKPARFITDKTKLSVTNTYASQQFSEIPSSIKRR